MVCVGNMVMDIKKYDLTVGNTACVPQRDHRLQRQTYLTSNPNLPFITHVQVSESL